LFTRKPPANKPAPIRFAIVGMPRTGSSYLQDSLDSHPQIGCRNSELFNPGAAFDQSQQTLNDFLQEVFSIQAQAAGCKWLIDGMHRPQTWPTIQAHGLKLLHTTRANLFDAYVSLQLATLNNAFNSWYGEYKTTTVTLDPRKAVNWFLLSEETNEDIYHEAQARGIPRLEVEYEALNQGTIWPQVFHFLGVEPGPMQSILTKQKKTTTREAIGNWEEVVAALERTRWERFFN
jgi:hypothetical protein